MFDSLSHLLKDHQLQLVTAESCTGGLLAGAITASPGSSAWFDRGFVTYSNLAKQQLLGVSPDTLKCCGAVSQETALEMAIGALNNSVAQISLSVTGIAGPDGGTLDKPVGTVCFGWASHSLFEPFALQRLFQGDRAEIRQKATDFALDTLYQRLLLLL